MRTVPEPALAGGGHDSIGDGDRHALGRPARDVHAPAQVSAGLPDAAGVPHLQRRHRHDHPDGVALWRAARHRRAAPDRARCCWCSSSACRSRSSSAGWPAASARSGRSSCRWRSTPASASSATSCRRPCTSTCSPILVGTVQGGSQALSRSLFASMIPRERSSEFFGFFAVTERTAGILGPLTFAAAIALTGSSRGAILSVIAYFIVGALILSRVDIEAGQAAVERRTSKPNAERRLRPRRRRGPSLRRRRSSCRLTAVGAAALPTAAAVAAAVPAPRRPAADRVPGSGAAQ